MWPVILRELRTGSRRWTTYWLRLLGASAVVCAVIFWMMSHVSGRRAGSEMFVWMHRVVLAAIWVLVPLMCCDCLSLEKREGTLGLLFLTNLKAREIVLAKAVAHGLRALTLWLAVIPVIVVPFLVGGLDWREIVVSCCMAFGSICFALSIGLFASALSRRINGAVGLVAILVPIGHGLFVIYALATMILGAVLLSTPDWGQETLSGVLELSVALAWNFGEMWREIFTGSNKYASAALFGTLCIPFAALAFLFCVSTVLVAPIIRRNWQDKPKTKQQSEAEDFFCKPVFWTGAFRAWMRRSLERNPIGWLEKRSWTGRITALIWLAVMISFASGVAYETSRDYAQGFNVLMWLLLTSIAYVAAGSFRRERETGALELILVTPLSERQIISGRLRALWNQFLPTFVLWVAAVLFLASALKVWPVANLIQFAAAYLIVPVVGLYFSLRSRFVLLSWMATLAVCFAFPQLIWWTFLYLRHWNLMNLGLPTYGLERLVRHPLFVVISVQLALAALLLWRLRVNLVRRSFSFR